MKINVFFFADCVEEKLPKIDEHYNLIHYTSKDITSYHQLSSLIRKHKPVTFCTTGKMSDWPQLYKLPYEYRKQWIHIEDINEVKSHFIENCYIHSMISNRFSKSDPLFSIISTTFHSGEKIFRPYNSLKGQTYLNWEWIIWDDSKEEHNDIWKQLLQFQEQDIRINCFRAPQHSGYIGEMKWRSASLSKGEWIVELDHDDIIDHRLFEWCLEAVKKHPDADFLCTNCIELHEDTEEQFSYGDFTAFGYGYYHKEWLRGKWHNVYHVPHMNPKTIRHIVGVPNHVRIWRRSFYEKIGRHNPQLPVVDDYELLLRSYLEGKWVYIDVPGYFQYRNKGGNNFTFLRNSLIQHLTNRVYYHYKEQIDNLWKVKDIENNYKHIYKAWENPDSFTYNKGFDVYVPNIYRNNLSVILTVEDESEQDILQSIQSVVDQNYTSWTLIIIGNKSSTLDAAMNKACQQYEDDIIQKIKWWNLESKKDRQISLNYAHMMLVNTEWLAYLDIGASWSTSFLSEKMKELEESTDKKLISSTNSILYNSIHHFSLLKDNIPFSDKTIHKLSSNSIPLS